MTERHESGVLDTCVYLDLAEISPEDLPRYPELTAVTLAELHQGLSMARTSATKAARTEQLSAAIAEFDALPFNDQAAARYGTLVSLILEVNRNPRPRKLDLMIAAIASTHDLPLYTRNGDDFKGLESSLTLIEL